MRTRPNAMSKRAVVTSSSAQASLIGARIMEAGGNVVDAAIATSAALAVTQNNLCGIGGDMFALVRMDDRGVTDVNGSGRAGSLATVDFYREKGMREIPQRGEYSAITVPGLVGGWLSLHRQYASMEISQLLKPAFELASEGFPVTHNYSQSIETTSRYLSQYNWAHLFMPSGRIPRAGELFRQPDLSMTIKELMENGLESFYDGHLADRIISGLSRHNSLITDDDFRKHRTTVGKPLQAEYHGIRVYETSPNSQGAAAIIWLNILEAMSSEGSPGLSPYDVMRSGLSAYSERSRWITDPEYLSIPDSVLSKEHAADLMGQEITTDKNAGLKDRGDTTYFTVADSEGNAVSFIQSNYMGFGSGIVPDGTGFVMQNRGCYFTLDEKHHNSLKPGKRTFHTLCASMGEKDGDLLFSLGTMGGDIQPQIHVQLIRHMVDEGMDPQLALDSPRWAMPFTIYEKPSQGLFESSLGENEISALNRILQSRKIEGFSSQFGHAQAIMVLPGGVIEGGADPRGDGLAIPVLR